MFNEEEDIFDAVIAYRDSHPEQKRRSWTLFKCKFEYDWQFFAIMPAININLHTKTIEFEWLFFAIYFDKQ